MTFSAINRFGTALNLSQRVPGGRSAVEIGGGFQPTTLEKLAATRAQADDQFDNQFVEQFRGVQQNRLNFLTNQLQQAYSALLQSTAAAEIKHNSANSYTSGYVGGTAAFDEIGGNFAADHDGDGIPDMGFKGVTPHHDATYFEDSNRVNFRAFREFGTAIDLKENLKITMRAEEMGAPPFLNAISPGFNAKVREFSAGVSTGGFWAGLNYLYAWRPSEMDYDYINGYSQNSDAAGFDGYLSKMQLTSGHNPTPPVPTLPSIYNGGDYGDGTFTGSQIPFAATKNIVKWDQQGFGAGYSATYHAGNGLDQTYNDFFKNNNDVGTDGIGGNDNMEFANSYYLNKRSVSVTPTTYNLGNFAAGLGNTGVIAESGETVVDNRADGFHNFDIVNGNVTKKPRPDGSGDTDTIPGSGQIEEKFTGKFAERQYTIAHYEGNNIRGTGSSPLFGGIELGRLNAYFHPDDKLTIINGATSRYLNGVNLDPSEVDEEKRLGQKRTFDDGAGGLIERIDQRKNDKNSLQEQILDILRSPKYRDIMRLGLFKDIIINGSMNSPAGGMAQGTIRLTYVPRPVDEQDWNGDGATNGLDTTAYNILAQRGRGNARGVAAQIVIYQDKFVAKGA